MISGVAKRCPLYYDVFIKGFLIRGVSLYFKIVSNLCSVYVYVYSVMYIQCICMHAVKDSTL